MPSWVSYEVAANFAREPQKPRRGPLRRPWTVLLKADAGMGPGEK
jgi:hypothetical protein